MAKELKLWSDGEEWVIARSRGDAVALSAAANGCKTLTDYLNDGHDVDWWKELPDHKMLTMRLDLSGECIQDKIPAGIPTQAVIQATASVRQWLDANPEPKVLMSVDW